MATTLPKGFRIYGFYEGVPASWLMGPDYEPLKSKVGFCFAPLFSIHDEEVWPPIDKDFSPAYFHQICLDCFSKGWYIGSWPSAPDQLKAWWDSRNKPPAKVPALPPEVWKVTPFDPNKAMDAVRDLCG